MRPLALVLQAGAKTRRGHVASSDVRRICRDPSRPFRGPNNSALLRTRAPMAVAGRPMLLLFLRYAGSEALCNCSPPAATHQPKAGVLYLGIDAFVFDDNRGRVR